MFMLAFSVGAQTEKHQKFLSEVYSDEEILDLQNKNLKELYLKFASTGILVTQMASNNGKYEVIESVVLRKSKEKVTVSEFLSDYNSGNFNALKYSWRPQNQKRYLRLINTDIYITIPSIKDLKL